MGGRTTEEDRADPDLDGYLDGEGPDVSGLSAGAVNSAGNPSEPVATGAGEGEAVELSTACARPKCSVLVSFASVFSSCI
jgi:hypothetical protein